MKATVKGNLPPAPEPTKAVRIDLPEDFSKYMNPPEDNDEPKEETKTESNGKRGKDKEPRSLRRSWTQEEIDEMLLMYKKGHSQREIAAALHRSRGNVCAKLAEHVRGIKRVCIPKNANKTRL